MSVSGPSGRPPENIARQNEITNELQPLLTERGRATSILNLGREVAINEGFVANLEEFNALRGTIARLNVPIRQLQARLDALATGGTIAEDNATDRATTLANIIANPNASIQYLVLQYGLNLSAQSREQLEGLQESLQNIRDQIDTVNTAANNVSEVTANNIANSGTDRTSLGTISYPSFNDLPGNVQQAYADRLNRALDDGDDDIENVARGLGLDVGDGDRFTVSNLRGLDPGSGGTVAARIIENDDIGPIERLDGVRGVESFGELYIQVLNGNGNFGSISSDIIAPELLDILRTQNSDAEIADLLQNGDGDFTTLSNALSNAARSLDAEAQRLTTQATQASTELNSLIDTLSSIIRAATNTNQQVTRNFAQ